MCLRTARPSIHHHNQPSIIIQHPPTIIRLPSSDRHQYYAQHHHDPEPQHCHDNHPTDHHQHQQHHNHDSYCQKTSSRSSSHCTSRALRMEWEGGWECNNLLSGWGLDPPHLYFLLIYSPSPLQTSISRFPPTSPESAWGVLKLTSNFAGRRGSQFIHRCACRRNMASMLGSLA